MSDQSNTVTVPMDKVRLDGGTQCRAGTDPTVVEGYRVDMLNGDVFPALVVFHDGQHYWLADGFHRFAAHQASGVAPIWDVKQGDRRAAQLFSFGVNAKHGLQRNDDDKRRAVDAMVTDPEWQLWSDRRIADSTRTSGPFVKSRRVEAGILPTRVQGSNGKWYAYKAGIEAAAQKGEPQESDNEAPTAEGAEVVELDAGEYDPWDGHRGAEAKAWLETVSDWRLAEILAARPVKGCKGRAEKCYQRLRTVSQWTGDERIAVVDMSPGHRLAVARRCADLAARSNAEPIGGDEFIRRQREEVTSDYTAARLSCAPVTFEGPEADGLRLGLLESLQNLPCRYTGWAYASAADLAQLREVFPAWADQVEERSREKKERDRKQREERDATTGAAKLQADGVLALLSEDLTAEQLVKIGEEMPKEAADWFIENRCSWGVPFELKATLRSAVRAHLTHIGSPPTPCPNPLCAKVGGWHHPRLDQCTACRWSPKRAADSHREAMERAQALIDAGCEFKAPPSSPRAPVSLAVSQLPSGSCPICLAHPGLQLTTDRGEVLAEHSTPIDGAVCPGVSLPPDVAARLLKDLDDCAPTLIRLLSGLRDMAADPASLRILWEAAPDDFADDLKTWLDDGAPAAVPEGSELAQNAKGAA